MKKNSSLSRQLDRNVNFTIVIIGSGNSNDLCLPIDGEALQATRRIQESTRLKYFELASAYLQNPFAKLQVRKSRIHGWGLFARTKFKQNDMLVEYIGQKIRSTLVKILFYSFIRLHVV